jgi:hypothetical protein
MPMAAKSEGDDPWRVLRVATLLLVALYLPFYIGTTSAGQGIPRDGTGLVVGRDFLNLWMVGRAAWEDDPARYYDIPTYWGAIEAILGPGYPGQQWSYPPTALLVGAPFGLLPYLPALLLWTVLGAGAFYAALRLWTRDWRIIAPLMLCPAALFGIMSGQFACLAAAVMLAVLRWRETRPWLAGALLGLLTIKPQLGLLFPVLLLATGNWRAILAAGLVALGLAGLTALIWGDAIWLRYLTQGIANQSLILSDPEHLAGPFMPTLFMNLRAAGVPNVVAASCQAVLSIGAILLVWRTFRERPGADNLHVTAIFLACAIACTPYMLSYDSLALAVMAALLLRDGRYRWLLLAIIFLPLIQIIAGNWGIPGPALLPVLLAIRLAATQKI